MFKKIALGTKNDNKLILLRKYLDNIDRIIVKLVTYKLDLFLNKPQTTTCACYYAYIFLISNHMLSTIGL